MQIDILASATILKTKIELQLQQMVLIAEQFDVFKAIEFSIEDCDTFDFDQFNHLEHVVYIIQVTDFGNVKDATNLCSHIIDFKKGKKKVSFKLPQVNTGNCGDILYVGKSTGSFRLRLLQHIRSTSLSTFALHLDKWKIKKELARLKFKLLYSSIDFSKTGIENHVEQKDLLELIETSLHHQYKPLLGRSGH